MRRYLEFLVLAALIVLPLWIKLGRMGHAPLPHALQAQTQEALPEYTRKAPDVDQSLPLRRVLFIGNSYTFFNDMPMMIPWMAASVGGQKFRYAADMIAAGGYHLMQYAQDNAVLEKILKGGYAAVVLQEQSTLPVYTDGAAESLSAVRALAANARAAGALPILYGTWPRRAGNEFYAQAAAMNYLPVHTPGEMMRRLDDHFRGLEKAAGVAYVPVGLYWMRALPYFDLYQPDGSHPTVAGSYLAALLLYYAISGDAPDTVHWAPSALPEKEAAALRALAMQ
jgi:hypothetical protein